MWLGGKLGNLFDNLMKLDANEAKGAKYVIKVLHDESRNL